MALGLAGSGVEPLWDVEEPSLWKPLSILDTREPCQDTGSECMEEGLGGLLGKAAGVAEGRPAWTKGASCLICSSPPVSPREGHLRGLSTNPEHLWG